MSHRMRPAALGTLVLVVAACGGTSSGTPAPAATTPAAATTAASSATVAAVSTATTGAAAGTCPTATTVDTALGVTVSAPVGVPGGGTQLPAGSVAVVCEYHGTNANVLIEMITNTDPSLISKFSDKFPVPYASVSGVGDQARSFLEQLNAGKDNEGVVATKGSTLVEVTATSTPATLAQVEALVSQLL